MSFLNKTEGVYFLAKPYTSHTLKGLLSAGVTGFSRKPGLHLCSFFFQERNPAFHMCVSL